MKKVFVIGFLMTIAASAFAEKGTGQIGSVNEALAITGFAVVEDTDSLLKLKFRDEKHSIVLSKQRFATEKDAKAFCSNNSLSLDTDGLSTAILLAMSGAATADEQINKTITFDFKVKDQKVSGVWAWAGTNEQIHIVEDGKEMSTDTTTSAELSQLAKFIGKPEIAALPAICK